MEAIILAGGFGTRLRPAIDVNIPKPMAPIAERPFLEYLLHQAGRAGVTDVILSVGHLADVIESYFQDGGKWGLHIRYAREETPLGTGGAVRLASEQIMGDRFFVLNGDSYLDIHLGSLAQRHIEKGARASIALTRVENAQRYGVVDVDSEEQILLFHEKRNISSEKAQALINAGVYLFDRSVVDSIPCRRPVSIERDVFPGLIGTGFFGFAFSAFFLDIGVPDDYHRMQSDPAPLLRLFSASKEN